MVFSKGDEESRKKRRTNKPLAAWKRDFGVNPKLVLLMLFPATPSTILPPPSQNPHLRSNCSDCWASEPLIFSWKVKGSVKEKTFQSLSPSKFSDDILSTTLSYSQLQICRRYKCPPNLMTVAREPKQSQAGYILGGRPECSGWTLKSENEEEKKHIRNLELPYTVANLVNRLDLCICAPTPRRKSIVTRYMHMPQKAITCPIIVRAEGIVGLYFFRDLESWLQCNALQARGRFMPQIEGDGSQSKQRGWRRFPVVMIEHQNVDE
ncbi:hypothetical protein C8J55DRAFT_493400 [Lentinula edodes]|uniref:Uncharacterized protein n=1 Tax=Lentinula lateritia TaxID=40482 RepID=A0A9W9DDU4_9AGAR|nr:hypothetical protein C8J55DRAFT_493400 [Lentinula edodes]